MSLSIIDYFRDNIRRMPNDIHIMNEPKILIVVCINVDYSTFK